MFVFVECKNFEFCCFIVWQIKDDTKNGTYVENLTEEYVDSYEDVAQILMKVSCQLHILSILIYEYNVYCFISS